VDTLAYQPTLTPLIEQEGSFYDNKASFNRIFGSRSIASMEYVVPLHGDGLDYFLRGEFGGMLTDAVDKEELWPEEAQPHLPELRGFANLLLNADSCTPTIKLELPQLFHGAEKHPLMLYDKDTVMVHCGSLCTADGDEYRPLRVGSEVPRQANGFRLSDGGNGCSIRVGNSRLTFEWPDRSLQLTNSTASGPKITITSGFRWETLRERTFDVPTDLAELLMPETWPYRDVKDARREHAATDRLKLDPLELRQLECVADPGNTDRLARVMQLISGGKFRSSARETAKGEQFELMVCGANGIWAPDSGKSALNKLGMFMQVNVSQLKYSPDFKKMVSVLNGDVVSWSS
jgi:hypothetical protein